jgi:hypothetical protein
VSHAQQEGDGSWVHSPRWDRTSVGQVSSDVDFYIGGFGVQDSWKQLWDSSAFRRLRDSDGMVRLARDFQVAWGERRGSLARLRSIVENRNTKEALLFASDVFNEDIFFVADRNLSSFLDRAAMVLDKSHRLADPAYPADEKAELIYGWIDELGPGWEIPNLVLAGTIKDKNRALNKVDELEGLLRFGLGMRAEAQPILKLLSRVEDARGTRLQWLLPFDKIPWESIPTNEVFDRESLERLREVTEDKKIVITFGVLDDRFVIALGNSLDPLPRMDADSSLLFHPHMQLVRDHDQERITGIRYTSDRLANSLFELLLKGFFSKISQWTLRPMTYELEDSEFRDWLVACMDDAGWLDSAIGAHVPEPRGSTEISILRADRWEVHAHDRTKNPLFDGTRPLAGASHWGSNPLVALNVRLAEHPEYFATARSIVQRMRSRLEELKGIVERPGSSAQGNAGRSYLGLWFDRIVFSDSAWSIMADAAQWWQHRVLPSLDGEHLLVVHGGGLASHSWYSGMQPSDEPLPVPEIALLSGLREPEVWIQTLRTGRELLKRLFSLGTDTEFDAPTWSGILWNPERWDDEGAVTFGYPIPDNCPAPKSMMPRIRIGSGWSILSYSDSQGAQVAADTPPPLSDGWFALPLRAGKAAWIDLGGMASLLRPWIEYGLEQNTAFFREPQSISVFATHFQIDLQPSDISDALRALEHLGTMASVTTIADDGTSQSRSVFVFGRSNPNAR